MKLLIRLLQIVAFLTAVCGAIFLGVFAAATPMLIALWIARHWGWL